MNQAEWNAWVDTLSTFEMVAVAATLILCRDEGLSREQSILVCRACCDEYRATGKVTAEGLKARVIAALVAVPTVTH